MTEKKTSLAYKIIRGLVKLFYRKIEVEGVENLPDEPSIIVGNHSKMNGPISCELYFPGYHYIWCSGEMMHLKEVPAYAYRDFCAEKPPCIRWIYKIGSYLIAPLSVCVFRNANAIGVYHDMRIISTFKETVKKMQDGANVIVFPEHDQPHNHIVNDFQDRFVDTAKLYYKKTGKEPCFVPLYLAPNLNRMYIGKPIRFSAQADMEQERRRICNYLMAEITDMACALPEHVVIPYNNVTKKHHTTNLPKEVTPSAKTHG